MGGLGDSLQYSLLPNHIDPTLAHYLELIHQYYGTRLIIVCIFLPNNLLVDI